MLSCCTCKYCCHGGDCGLTGDCPGPRTCERVSERERRDRATKIRRWEGAIAWLGDLCSSRGRSLPAEVLRDLVFWGDCTVRAGVNAPPAEVALVEQLSAEGVLCKISSDKWGATYEIADRVQLRAKVIEVPKSERGAEVIQLPVRR